MMAEEGHFQWQVICYGDVTQNYDLDKMKEAKGVILDTQSALPVVGLVFLSWFYVASWDNELEDIQQKQFYASILPMTHLV